MAYNGVIYAGSLLEINTACAGSLLVLKPLLSSVDQSLFGPLGIGALRDNLQLQLTAAIQASANISLNIVNPLAGFQQALLSIAQLQASILKALAAGAIPAASLQVTTQIAALAKVAVSVGAQLANLLALIQALLNAKIPAVSFAGALAGSLSAGDAFLIEFDQTTTPVTLAGVGAQIASDFSLGLTSGPAVIHPTDPVYGVLIVTKLPSTWAALQTILKTAP